MARADWLPHSRRRASALPMVMLLADRLTSSSAPASAAWLDGGTGTQMSSQISTWKVTGDGAGRAEQQVGAERHLLAGELDRVLDDVGARHEVALLVELAVVRQVGLGHHAQDDAAMDDDGGVVEAARQAQRRADDQDGKELVRGLDDLGDRLLDLVQERILQQQVLDGVGREPSSGKTMTAVRALSPSAASRSVSARL